MGSHRPPSPTAEVDGWPSANTLFYEYVLPGKPLIIRNAVQKVWPAFQKWTDEYMLEKAGDVTVMMEHSKKEDRLGDSRVKLKEFLRTYQKPEKATGYVIEKVPKALLGDIGLPMDFAKLMVKPTDPTMWFSSGGTNSVLHKDNFENFNCIIAGRKEFVLINKNYWKEVYESDKYPGYGVRAPFDPDAVDLVKYPLFQHVPWHNASTKQGDCLYIPYSWFHQVRSYDIDGQQRSLAVNLWFMPPKRVDKPNFKETTFAELGDIVPFSNSKVWKFRDLEAVDEEPSLNRAYGVAYDPKDPTNEPLEQTMEEAAKNDLGRDDEPMGAPESSMPRQIDYDTPLTSKLSDYPDVSSTFAQDYVRDPASVGGADDYADVDEPAGGSSDPGRGVEDYPDEDMEEKRELFTAPKKVKGKKLPIEQQGFEPQAAEGQITFGGAIAGIGQSAEAKKKDKPDAYRGFHFGGIPQHDDL